jgi:predicted RNA-binding Zn-ribbon protein involved in translation (DUF1610 family)
MTSDNNAAITDAGAARRQRSHVRLRVTCGSCHGTVELECDGPPGYLGYETYNEYACPRCGKQNHQRCPGAVVSARVPLSG